MDLSVDIFLELTFQEVSNSQANRDHDHTRPTELGKYDRLADARTRYDR